MTKKNTVIIGNGEIGQICIEKIMKSNFFEITSIIESDVPIDIFYREIENLVSSDKCIDIVFNTVNIDLTGLMENKWIVINLIPKIGRDLFVPSSLSKEKGNRNIYIAPFPAQICFPFIETISNFYKISYTEIITTLSSSGVSKWIIENLDEVIELTSEFLEHSTKSSKGKAILLFNSAQPKEKMFFTINLLVNKIGDTSLFETELFRTNQYVQNLMENYKLNVIPTMDDEKITISIQMEFVDQLIDYQYIDLAIPTMNAIALSKSIMREKDI